MTRDFLSRRDFLKLSSAALFSLLISEYFPSRARAETAPILGRVVGDTLNVRDEPGFFGEKVDILTRDNIVTIHEQLFGGVDGDTNRTWYRIGNNRFVHSGWVQLVENRKNPVVRDIPGSGVLGEITIPNADSFWGINRNPYPGPRLYYGTTHWITSVVVDERDWNLWYKAYDDLYNAYYYTRPESVHLLTAEEFAPLSQNVPEEKKHIEINLHRQILMAFEWNVPVYIARVATGRKNYESPVGWFQTFHKRPTYHMTGGADEFSVFDLPGVPWDSYITSNGVAIHGTYWHNDFGQPHSHGCINMSIEDAKWVYRWTLPNVAASERFKLKPGTGTRVFIAST